MFGFEKKNAKERIYPEVVYAHTNAEFLNKRFGTRYQAHLGEGA